MFEDLQHALPRIQKYKQGWPASGPLETALFDLYSEIIVFCAHAITFFRNNPVSSSSRRRVWILFTGEFSQVIKNVQQCSSKVDEAAEMIRLSRAVDNSATMAALRRLQNLQTSDNANLPCYLIPHGLNLRFFSRADELRILTEELDPAATTRRFQAVGLHGLGGVGKSQLALQYAHKSMDAYEIIAWIPSESEIKLVQALSDLANKLGLTDGTSEDDYGNVQKVRDWLNQSHKTFLLIFDNVDNIELLDQIWPASSKASVIITTRSPSLAAKRAATTMSLQPFSDEVGPGVLRSLIGFDPASKEDESALEEICRLVGGLPLAMVQISDFMRERGCSYAELLRLYEKSAERIYAKTDHPVEYPYTVLTTWDISLKHMSGEATRLQNLVVFFDPDMIPERLITNTGAGVENPAFDFLFDEFE